MAKVNVVMPQMGESITNGTITKWHKAPGDKIELDEILLEISTDKVESEIPASTEGRLEKIEHEEGETVDVGQAIAVIEDDPDNVAFSGGEGAGPVDSAKADAKADKDQPEKDEQEKDKDQDQEKNKAEAPSRERASSQEEQKSAADSSQADSSSSTQKLRRFYTPLVKAMAKEHGVDLAELEQIQGSGAGARVNKDDFLQFLNNRKKGTQAPSEQKEASARPAATPSAPSSQEGERVEVVAMDNMRKSIARNMVASKQTSPHVNSVSEVDLSHLVKFRESFKQEFLKQEGFKLTYSPFIMYAIVQALKKFPRVNASIDGDNIVLKKDINLGCAVAVPGSGLLVPVVKQADTLNMLGLCRAVNDLADKARNKKITMEQLQGGTFTFTNVGSFGTLLATPVILQPQLGIYASGVIQKRVVVLPDDSIAVRPMMYGTHTYDHRLIDGEMGGLFLEQVHQNLREMKPEALF